MVSDDLNPSYINRFTLKQLGINYDHLVVHFIHKGLLPYNYLKLK